MITLLMLMANDMVKLRELPKQYILRPLDLLVGHALVWMVELCTGRSEDESSCASCPYT